MGEKGNADIAAGAVEAGTLISRTAVSASETVIGVGKDLASTIRDTAIETVAAETIAAARERIQNDDESPPNDDDQNPPAT
jgi:hypothetical protein